MRASKHSPLFFLAAFLLTLFTASTLRAQDLYVGSNSSGVSSNFTSGVNSYIGATYVGYDVGANSNILVVKNTSTVLRSSVQLWVGASGSSNSMVISNGGSVQNAAGVIGRYVTAVNNSVLVTGTNSGWNNSGNFSVGHQGSSNSLVISNGGTVQGTVVYIGRTSESSNNSVLVTGTNSLFLSSAALNVGNAGAGNIMVISNGGRVKNAAGTIGNSNTAVNNSVLVTGTNSLWTNSGTLNVGSSGGAGNIMVISNGGTAQNTVGYIGNGVASSNNSVLVTGTNSLWLNSSDLTVGRSGASNSLVISDGGQLQNAAGTIGSASTASNSSVLVTGAGSAWSNSSTLVVGNAGSGTLTVANGASIEATGITIAASNGSAGTLNIGRFGTNDAAGTIIAPTIAFGGGAGVINFNQSNSTTISAAISGNGTVNQLGTGTTILSASNSYTGSTSVQFGTLNLNAAAGAAKNTTSVTVSTDATLLISQSDQVNNDATVTLSGGTIARGSGASEVFGSLNLAAASFLNFGTGTTGNMTFGTYTSSSLLTINNFGLGNTLVFGSNLTDSINDTSLFQFSGGFTSAWNGSNTFTITAIPETSTYVAALGLIALCASSLLRRKRTGQ